MDVTQCQLYFFSISKGKLYTVHYAQWKRKTGRGVSADDLKSDGKSVSWPIFSSMLLFYSRILGQKVLTESFDLKF